MAGYTIPILVSGVPAIEAAVNAIQNLNSKTASFANSQIKSADDIAKATAKVTKAIHDQRIEYAKVEAADKRAGKKADAAGTRAPAPKLQASGAAFLAIVRETERAQRIFDGFSFTKLEKQYRDSTIELARFKDELIQVASNNRILLNGKTALYTATEKEAMANQNVKAALVALNAEQAKETRLLQLQYKELEKAATINERRAAALVHLRNEYEYAVSLEGRLAEQIKLDIKLAHEDAVATAKRGNAMRTLRGELEYAYSFEGRISEQLKYKKKLAEEDAIATQKRAEAQRKLNELRTGGPAAEDAKLAYQIKLASELAVADLKLIESKRVLVALGRPDSLESETAAIARQTAETKKLTASKQQLADLRNPASTASQQAALDAQLRAQREIVRLRAQANVSQDDRREITMLAEKAKLEQERARLLARSTREFRALEAEVVRLRHAEERAINPTKSLSMHLNLANQGAAALRSSIYGMGASFGVFTSSTVLIAASVYAVSRAFREGIVAAIDYEQKLAALGAMSSRASSLSPEYASDKSKLNQAVMSTAISSKYSTVEVAEAMKQLALAGLDVDQSIAATIPTMKLATIGQLGFAEAADIATNVMMGFGMHVEQLPKIIDVLAKAATESNTDVTQLGNAMSYAAPIANSFGVSLEYTAAAMEVLANAGIKSSRAGTGMRRVLVSLFTPTQKITEAVEGFGISLGKVAKEGESLESLDFSVGKLIEQAGGAQEAQRMLEEFYVATAGGTKNLQLLRETVGVYALPAMTQLVKSVGLGTKSIQAFADSLTNIEGTAEQQSAKMLDNLKDVGAQLAAAGSALAYKLYDEEKSGLRAMLEHLLAIARTLAQSAKLAGPVTAAMKALGAAVLQVVGILVGLKLGFLALSTSALIFSKVTATVKNLGMALDWLKARYVGVGAAAAAAAASSQAAAGAGAVGGAGTLAALGLSVGGLVTGAALLVGIGATLYYIYKQFSGIGEAVDAVNEAFTVMKSESEAYNRSLQETYDRLAGGDLVRMYEERARIEIEMLDTSGKTLEQTKELKDAYAAVNKEITGAHRSLSEFGSTTLLLSKVAKQKQLDQAQDELAVTKSEVARLERDRRNDLAKTGLQGMRDPAKYLAKSDEGLAKAREAQAIQEELVKGLKLQVGYQGDLQKILTNGTALEQAQQLGVLNASLTTQIKEQEAAVRSLSAEVAAGDTAKAERLGQASAALDKLYAQQRQVAQMEKLTQDTIAAGAIPYENIVAQQDKARKKHLEDLRLLNGTEQERAAAALATAQEEKVAADAKVAQLEAIRKALKDLMEAEKEGAVRSIYTQAILNVGSDLGAAYTARLEALDAYNKSLKTSEGLQDREAKAMGKVIKSAAELHEAQQALIKDLADFKRGFTELNEEILSRGTEVFADMTNGAKELSGALKEVTLSGAQVAGLKMSKEFTPAAGGRYSDLINAAGSKYGVDPELIRRVVGTESAYNPNAVSNKGAAGLMQIMPATAKELGIAIADRFVPEIAIDAGTRYLKEQLESSGGDVRLALAKYNAGPGAVKRYGGVPPYEETVNYVNKITKGYGGASLEDQNLSNIDQSKSVTILVRDEEALARAKAATAEQTKAQYDAQAHLDTLMQAEVSTYATAKDAYAEAAFWQDQINAGKKLNVTQTAAATASLEKANSTWKAYTAAHTASLAAEEQSIRLGELKTIQVERSSAEIEKLKEEYVDGDAAMKDYNYTLAMNNFLLGKGILSMEQYRQNLSDATRKVAQSKGEYASFFDSLRYDAKSFEKIGTGAMTSFRDSIAEALASGKMDFEKFLTYLRDAAARFAADNIMAALFKPADDGGKNGGLLAGFVKIASKVITSYLTGGASVNDMVPVDAMAHGGSFRSALPSGVYSSPTFFAHQTPGLHAFAAGTGLLGEAGPEAVLPLTRIGGDLGVKAQPAGPAQINVTVNNLPGQAANVRQEGNSLSIDIIEQALASRIAKGGTPISKGLENSYAGMRRQGR